MKRTADKLYIMKKCFCLFLKDSFSTESARTYCERKPSICGVIDDILDGGKFDEGLVLELQRKANERQPNAKSSYPMKVMEHHSDRKLYAVNLGGVALKRIQDSNISFQTPGATVK